MNHNFVSATRPNQDTHTVYDQHQLRCTWITLTPGDGAGDAVLGCLRDKIRDLSESATDTVIIEISHPDTLTVEVACVLLFGHRTLTSAGGELVLVLPSSDRPAHGAWRVLSGVPVIDSTHPAAAVFHQLGQAAKTQTRGWRLHSARPADASQAAASEPQEVAFAPVVQLRTGRSPHGDRR